MKKEGKEEGTDGKKNPEGRITKIKPDIYERLKKDSRYKKMPVDQYVDSLLRRELFSEKKRSSSGKKDFLGYCPNCHAMVKVSTLKRESTAEKQEERGKSSGKSFLQKLFKKD